MKKILFLDTCNNYESHNPIAYLVEISDKINKEILYTAERLQKGVNYLGGKWEDIMKSLNIEYKLISEGRKSDYSEHDYNELYSLINGNY